MRRAILPSEVSDSRDHQYSQAVVADGTLYVSGQVATDRHGEYVGTDVETQTRRVFENVGHILEEVGSEFEDIVKLTTYLVDIETNYEGFRTVYTEYFQTEPYPCHTILGVQRLASAEPLVEIEFEIPHGALGSHEEP